MERFEIERLSPADYSRWDEYVLAHPAGTVFHTTAWLGRLTDELSVLVCHGAGGKIVGGIALIESRKYGVRGYHLPPFTTYFGPLITPSDQPSQVSAHGYNLELVQTILNSLPKARHYDFMLVPEDTDLLPYIWNGYQTTVRYSYVLSGTFEDYLANMLRKRRQNRNQAIKEVEAGNLCIHENAGMEELISILEAAEPTTGMRFKPGIFRRLWEFDPERLHWRLIIIRDQAGEAIAGVVFLFTDRKATALVSAVSDRHRQSQNPATILAYDSMIKFCLASGRTLDFCGSVIPGIEQYLRSFGGKLTAHYRVQNSSSLRMFGLRALNQYLKERKAHHEKIEH